MQRRLVVDRDLFTGCDIAQRDKENVVTQDLHECVWHARVVNVVGAVSTATAIQAPATIDLTDPEHLAMRAAASFSVCDLLARVFRDFSSLPEWNSREAALAVDGRRLNCETGSEL